MDDIAIEKRGRAGLITLDRPHALNAVTAPMLHAIDRALEEWEQDAGVERVVIRAAGGRAFSAGGDIRDLYERCVSGRYDVAFFRHEYTLNLRIARYAKPYIALIDGIAMGGGVGVSFHGSHRVAGGGLAFAMPEVGIGFFPDVGGSYLLSRLPGAVGLYLGLTGERVRRADALALGLATHACPSAGMAALLDDLCETRDIAAALDRHMERDVGEGGPILAARDAIDATFDAPDLVTVMRRLEKREDDWSARALATLRDKAPLSLHVAFEQIRRAAALSLEECMVMEFRILTRMLRAPDFIEGVRAAIIDKDGSPRWCHRDVRDVEPSEIAAHFEPAIDGDLLDGGRT